MDRKNMVGQNQRNLETASRAHGSPFAVIGGLKLAISLGTQVVCAVIMSQYKLSQPRDGTNRQSLLHGAPRPVPTAIEHLSLPSFILDPSAFTFFCAFVLYDAAVLVFGQLRCDHRYQNYFLAVGVSVGILVAAFASVSGSSLDPIKSYVAISLTASLTLSLVYHALLYGITANPHVTDGDSKL